MSMRLFFLLFTFLILSPLRAEEVVPKISYLHYLKYLLYQRSDEPSRALAELILAYQANPKAAELAREIVEVSLDMRQLEIAKVYLQVARQLDPKSVPTRLLEAKVLMVQGRNQEALTTLKEIYKLDPENPEILIDLAALYAETNDKASAMRYLNSYLNSAGATPELLKVKAAYQIDNNDPGALETLRDAFSLDPEDPEILEGLIQAYQKFSDAEELESFLSEASRENPNSIALRLKLCGVLDSPEDRKNCFANALEAEPASAQLLGNLLELYEKEEAWEEALEILRSHPQATAADPVFALKESFYLLHLDNLKEAVSTLEQRRGQFPKNDDIAYFLALGYQDRTELDKAMSVLKELYARRPEWREMAYTYALIANESGATQIMEKILKDLNSRYPDDPAIANALGFTWAEQGKNLAEAKTLIERALSTDPKNYFYQDSLAWLLFKSGKTAEAEALLRKAAQMTQDPEILLHLAQLDKHEGRDQQAWSSYLSAKFEMARAKKSSARLMASMKSFESRLSNRAKPAARQVLRERAAKSEEGFAGEFRCEWRLRGQSPFRSRLTLAAKAGEDMNIRYWPPGALKPMSAQEIGMTFEAGRMLLEEFEAALIGFFQHHSWDQGSPSSSAPMKSSEAALRWKIKDDYSVRAKSPHLKTEFSDFYRDAGLGPAPSGSGSLVPRTIRLNGRHIKATCEAMDYAKE